MDNINLDKLATERVLKARTELILSRRFYGVLVSNVEPVVNRAVPTMATDGKRHYFHPEFIMGLKKNWRGQEVSPAELMLGVQAHESEHDARHHGTRRNGRDPVKWNEACDYNINLDLVDQGFQLPWGALIDERFRGMSAEDIYRTRELDKQKEQPKPEPEDEDDDSSDDSDDGNGDQGDAGEPQDEPEDDGAPGEGDEGDEPSEASQGAGEASGNGKGEPKSSGDTGGCGEVLDTAEDAGDIAEQDQKWERIVRQAASMAKAVGQLPGHVSREIERANNPPQDWREVLRAWFDQGALRRETWNRPNRRFVGNGLYLPGNERDGVNRVVFGIDTSGSIDEVALAAVRNEAQAALDDGVISEIVAVYCDTQVTRTDIYRTGDEVEFDPRGGGGTDLRPLFKYAADEVDDVSLIVCFTDGYIPDPGPEPSCPVLWAYTGYPQVVRNMIANAPWGSPGIDLGSH
jgi:predicted metal-dependent peptidase